MQVIFPIGGGRVGHRRRLRRRWYGFWERVEAQGDPARAFAELDRRYGASTRHYHTWEHIDECFAELEEAAPRGEDTRALEMALWFHDSVYDPRASDNEERSAAWARDTATEMGLSQGFSRRVADLIMATRHVSSTSAQETAPGGRLERPNDDPPAATRSGAETRLIRDVDLAILGSPRRRYRRYERSIRREYAWVPAEEFRRRRGALLQGLLGRRELYATELFRRRHEARARANLRWSLRRLGFPEGQGDPARSP